MANANYSIVVCAETSSVMGGTNNKAVGSVDIRTLDDAGTTVNVNASIIVTGGQ